MSTDEPVETAQANFFQVVPDSIVMFDPKSHCWHDQNLNSGAWLGGTVTLTNGSLQPQTQQVCCHCSGNRSKTLKYTVPPGHGKYYPRGWHDYTYEYTECAHPCVERPLNEVS